MNREYELKIIQDGKIRIVEFLTNTNPYHTPPTVTAGLIDGKPVFNICGKLISGDKPITIEMNDISDPERKTLGETKHWGDDNE